MTNDDKPWAADATRRATQFEAGDRTRRGAPLDRVFSGVQRLGPPDGMAVRDGLRRPVKVDTCVPSPAEGACASAVYSEYVKWDEGEAR